MTRRDREYELLDRIGRGEQIFRPQGLRLSQRLKFSGEVECLLDLRDRGWIRLDNAGIARTPDGEYLAIGPCQLTPLGREKLGQEMVARDRRMGARRREDRHESEEHRRLGPPGDSSVV